MAIGQTEHCDGRRRLGASEADPLLRADLGRCDV